MLLEANVKGQLVAGRRGGQTRQVHPAVHVPQEHGVAVEQGAVPGPARPLLRLRVLRRRGDQLLQRPHGQGLLDDEDARGQVRRDVLVGDVLQEAGPVAEPLRCQADALPGRRALEADHVLRAEE